MIGAGNVGGNLGARLSSAGFPLRFGVRSKEKVKDLLAACGGDASACDPEEAADYVARMLLSFIGNQGRWDLADPADVARLVRTELLAGILVESDA